MHRLVAFGEILTDSWNSHKLTLISVAPTASEPYDGVDTGVRSRHLFTKSKISVMTMATTIPPELEAFVEREVASGKFRSRDEAISEGLRLLKEREEKLDLLRNDIQAGLDQLDHGQAISINDAAEHRKFFDDIQRRGLERLAAKKNVP